MSNENAAEAPIEKRSIKEFSDYYLKELKANLRGFGNFFAFVSTLFGIQVLISIMVALFIMDQAGIIGGLQMILITINLAVIIWFSSLGKRFVKLQIKKVENDIRSTIEYQSESAKLAKEILKKAEQKAENMITIHGGNAVLAFNGSSISGINQTITVQGEGELVKSLALLVSFCKETGNAKALEMATKLSEEATKKSPDKGILFDLWGGITAALPEVAGIVKIAQGIKSLFV